MIALFALLIVVAALGTLAAWLGDNPGMVAITWMDYRIETSVGVMILLAALAALIAAFAYDFLKRLLLAPARFSERRSLKYYRLGLSEVTHSIAALAASDINSAIYHTHKAEKALGESPLTLLLRAQISKNRGNDEETRTLLTRLIEHPETEYLAAKSLADVAQKQQQLPQALGFAERAHRANPKETQGAWAVFDLLLNAGQFPEAEAHAIHARKTKAFARADVTAAKGKIALHQAALLEEKGQKDHALALAQHAVDALKGNPEAATLCARLYKENQQPARALRIIQSQWKITPTDALAQLFKELIDDEPPAKQKKLIEKLVASNEAAAENVTLLSLAI